MRLAKMKIAAWMRSRSLKEASRFCTAEGNGGEVEGVSGSAAPRGGSGQMEESAQHKGMEGDMSEGGEVGRPCGSEEGEQ